MKRGEFLCSLAGLAAWQTLSARGNAPTPLLQRVPDDDCARQAAVIPPKDHPAVRACNAALRAKDPRPNVLLLFTDQQTFDALGCAGNPHVSTPNMDYLASRGVRFERAYCASPVCGPSRACLLSSRMPHETGVRFNGGIPQGNIPFIGHVLSEQGYDVTWTGKWHLPQTFPAETRIHGFNNLPLPGSLAGMHLGDVSDMLTCQLAAKRLRWEAGLSPKPWFLGVSVHNPHDICHYFNLRSEHLGVREIDPQARSPETLPPLPANFEPDPNEPDMLRDRRTTGELARSRSFDPQHWRAYLHRYYRLTETVDRCFSPLLDALAEGGWLDNTLVIFTSDHGEGMASHRWATKLGFYEPIVRVPMIVVPPGGFSSPAPRVERDGLFSLLDILPTVLDYAGVPAEKWPLAHGVSMRPAIEGGTVDREYVVVSLDPNPRQQELTARTVVSRDGWKYCYYGQGERAEQLFDLKADPLEQHNLAADAAFAARRERLRGYLREWGARTHDPFLAGLS